MQQQPQIHRPAHDSVLRFLTCTANKCQNMACILPKFDPKTINVYMLRGCKCTYGSHICHNCYQRFHSKKSWSLWSCKECSSVFSQVIKLEVSSDTRNTIAIEPVVAHAMLKSVLPLGSSPGNMPSLREFIPLFQMLGANDNVCQHFVVILQSLILAQSSTPKLLCMTYRLHPKILKRMLCFSMTHKLFYKLKGRSRDSANHYLCWTIRRMLARFHIY